MIKLTKLLYEIIGSPKAIIMAGSAGAGKTYIVNTFKNDAKGWLNFNPDKYARNPESPFYKNLYQASKATDTELTGALESQDKSNFIWDTTGLNTEKVSSIPNAGYNVLMIMVYTHPMAAYYQNFKRAKETGEESIFGKAILDTWAKAYKPELIETYQKMFGDNFILVNNTPKNTDPKLTELINGFNEAAQKNPEAIKQFITSETKKDPEFFTVTQKKEKETLPSDVEADFQEKTKSLGSLTPYEERKLKEKALEYYTKNNTFMPINKQGRSNGFKENLDSIRKQIEKAKEEEQKTYVDLYNTFKDIVPSEVTIDEATSIAKQFINS
jgi:predicted ABC-type ATPase